jgi:plastocyanin
MISNHFPGLYGEATSIGGTVLQWNWLILLLLCLAGAFVKLAMNVWHPSANVGLAALLVLVVATAIGSAWPMLRGADESVPAPVAATSGKPIGATGRVHGTVSWTGEVPKPRDVALYGGCEIGHEGALQLAPAIVKDGKLAEAFVVVTSGVDGYAIPAPPAAPVVVTQHGCLYQPRVSGVRVGQPMQFVNSDAIFHNVRAVATNNETFALNQAAQGQKDVVTFKKPELMVETRCDIHPWMVSHIGVVDHPWFAVTGDDGAFSLDGVPAGDLELTVWSDAGGVQKKHVTVPPSGDVTVDFAVGAK